MNATDTADPELQSVSFTWNSLNTYSTKREKMKLITLVTKRAITKGQYKRARVMRIQKRNGSDQKDWWKRPTPSKMDTKRKILKGSADGYLLKRTIELEID